MEAELPSLRIDSIPLDGSIHKPALKLSLMTFLHFVFYLLQPTASMLFSVARSSQPPFQSSARLFVLQHPFLGYPEDARSFLQILLYPHMGFTMSPKFLCLLMPCYPYGDLAWSSRHFFVCVYAILVEGQDVEGSRDNTRQTPVGYRWQNAQAKGMTRSCTAC